MQKSKLANQQMICKHTKKEEENYGINKKYEPSTGICTNRMNQLFRLSIIHLLYVYLFMFDCAHESSCLRVLATKIIFLSDSFLLLVACQLKGFTWMLFIEFEPVLYRWVNQIEILAVDDENRFQVDSPHHVT
jgi:hypothetical protein